MVSLLLVPIKAKNKKHLNKNGSNQTSYHTLCLDVSFPRLYVYPKDEAHDFASKWVLTENELEEIWNTTILK